MVIEDLSVQSSAEDKSKSSFALPQERFFSSVFDFLLLTPILTLVTVFHLKEIRQETLSGFSSNLWFQLIILVFLSYVVLLSVFLYWFKSTPGQSIFNLKVQSLNSQSLSWNQCLLRSFFYVISQMLFFLPFLEVFTHPKGLCFHDRASDTFVLDPKLQSTQSIAPIFKPQTIRVVMIFGFFLMVGFLGGEVMAPDELQLDLKSDSSEPMDVFVARALLNKNFDETTRMEVEARLWKARRKADKALAYFYRFQNEKDLGTRRAFADQICKWEVESLCLLTTHLVSLKSPSVTKLELPKFNRMLLSARVVLMQELTRESRFVEAFGLHKSLSQETHLQDALRAWDVSLFIQAKSFTQSGRRPASSSLEESLSEYEKSRGQP